MKVELPRARRPLTVCWLAGLAVAVACTGEIEPSWTEINSISGQQRDAGNKRDAGRDAGNKRDAGGADDELIDTPTDEQLPGTGGPDEDFDAGDDLAAPRDGGPGPRDGGNATPDAGNLTACANDSELPLARGLKVRELSLYQTVKVPLFKAGAWVPASDVPIIAGKKTLLRVFVDTASGYSRHGVRALLKLQGAQGTTTLQDDKSIAASSTDADQASTFAFTVDGSKIGTDTQLSVSLHETDCAATAGSATDTRVPTTGSRALGAQAIGKLKVVVVPIDIAGRLPKTDEAELTKIRSALLAYYPVAEVELSVRAAPLKWPGSVSGNDSNAWTNVLNQVMRERSSDRAGTNVYYFGLMQPAATFSTFCGSGCILGIAPQTTRVSPSSQAGLGAYFTDRADISQSSLETVIHELGHAHGRGHAPCVKGGQIEGVDGSFPDKTGATGEWGWDSRSGTLLPPTHKDVMGYCSPDWISPYTYAALAERSLRVNAQPLVHGAPALTSWHNVLLYEDGTTRWGGATETTMPGGELETATVLDSAGQAIATTEVIRLVLSHSTDEILYVPTASSSWAALVLSDRTLQLGQIQAAF